VTHLFWFRNDLRLADNPGLSSMANADRLLCVYFWPRDVPWCNSRGMGPQRQRFLLESLAALRLELGAQGQELLVFHDAPENQLPKIVRQFRVGRIGVTATPGFYEKREIDLVSRRTGLSVEIQPGNTLFSEESVYRQGKALAAQFTPFRQSVEELAVDPPMPAPALPPPPTGLYAAELPQPKISPHPSFTVRGGRASGLHRLSTWMFRERAVSTYRDTRNALEGQFYASSLSPWLAIGCLSVREVVAALLEYEQQHGRNESTAHYFSELLWREFFHWRACSDGMRLFLPGGLRRQCRLHCFEPRNYARWCAGDTDYPLVNALMHQLVATGFMSNRGRQIAASCFVNELQLDWRYGAAFFEKHLIDYDVGSNYGNWQYIAGVGTDPRGGRHFNIEKQASLFDPQGEFTARWDGNRAPQPEFVVDAADWPIDSTEQ
jgi:deoxyribodipyrimidine photo-lyase